MGINLGFSGKILLQKGQILAELTGNDWHNDAIFSFLIMSDENVKSLSSAIDAEESINITEYGRLLHYGMGTPTEFDREVATQIATQLLQRDKNIH